MDTSPIETKLNETIRDELRRQAANSGGDLRVEDVAEDRLRIEGVVDLDDLVMVITGSVAGGP